MKTAYIALGATACLAAILAAPATSDVPPPPPSEPAVIPITKACDNLEMSIYFPAHEAMMSSYALRTISAAGDRLDGCAITEIKADVISEESHTEEDLARLSEARATAVLQALKSNGIDSANTQTDVSHMRIDTATYTRPMARRVEVSVKAVPSFGL
jgi:outer membrane protein OmpA-like peptidoglycan-associated protein